ncbi:MAG: site-specific integrase [Actinomycetota bacterium]|nr:site-specific integrase [Actinomycetota bacterium]
MATIREKRPGVWEVRVFTGSDARGRPTQMSRTVRGGKRDAQRLAAQLESSGGNAKPAGRSVSDVLTEWVKQNIDTWAPSSARDQQSRVKSLKKDQIARLPLARLTVADIERWHTRLRAAGMADAGIKNQHGVLCAALSQAVRWGWVSSNVASLARLRSTKTQPRTMMTVDDVRAVMTAAASIDAAAELAFRIAAVAGARRAELASLRWTDEHNGQLLIDSAIEITKRGDGAPELREAATKTANVRTVTLDADTVEMIDKLRRVREPYGPWMCGLGPELVSPDRISWWWKRARQMSGIDPRWRLHDLRHWSASVAIGQGHDVRTVAGRLGHANPAMTLRVYAHAFAAADQAVAAGLGEMLKGDGK